MYSGMVCLSLCGEVAYLPCVVILQDDLKSVEWNAVFADEVHKIKVRHLLIYSFQTHLNCSELC